MGAAALVAAAGLTSQAPGATAATEQPANLSAHLVDTLSDLTGGEREVVMVHGATLQDAEDAVAATGMTRSFSFDKIGVVGAVGTAEQIRAVRSEPGVTYVEGNQPIEFFQDTSNQATRGYEATQTLTGADGTPLTGTGVSVAVIDTGVDPTHPYFAEEDGSSAVVANLKTVCDPLEAACTVQSVPTSVDTDTLSLGGHGTHVNGIVAGRPTTLTSGKELQGAAPGASLVSLSTGAALLIVGADAALNWELENHEAPCGEGVTAA
jgi:serine protease AprX